MRALCFALVITFGCSSSGAGSDAGAVDGATSDVASDAGGDASPTQGLTKVGTGEYATLYLVDGVIYGYGSGAITLGQGPYQGLCIPPRPLDVPSGTTFVDVQGGLHQSMGLDATGHVWTWGEADQGLQGSGADGDSSVPYEIMLDVNGNPFDHVVWIEPTVSDAASESMYDLAIKDDGTIWAWGNLGGGLRGDGTAGGIVQKPTQIPITLPSGVKFTKVLGASAAYALASDGSVWAWGTAQGNMLGTGTTGATDGYVPAKVHGLPANVKDIAIGYAAFDYALTSDGELFGWGYGGGYLGFGTDTNHFAPQATAVSLTSTLALPGKVVHVAADFMTTHVILDDGSLWGWGDDAMGLVGDGRELDFSKTATPYAWDFGAFELPVWKPVRIAPAVTNWKAIFTHSPFLFYDYAITTDGVLYSWGRNKTGALGNGVYPLTANGNSGTSSAMAGTYPNSWDVTRPTAVTPFTTPPTGVISPYCVTHPTATNCQ